MLREKLNLKGIKLILGSQSPRRKELLSSLGNEFAVAPGSVDFEEALGVWDARGA